MLGLIFSFDEKRILDRCQPLSASKASEANTTLEMALSSMSVDYISDYYENDLDFDEKNIEDYFTFEEVNDELEDSGYFLCDENGKKLNNSKMNKTVVGETIYFIQSNDEDKIVYQADIVISGTFGVKSENFGVVQ